MVATLTQRAKEEFRQSPSGADDGRFVEPGIYFFELEFPAEATKNSAATGAAESYIFPLILNPESIRVEEKFTVSKVPTANGGLYVEENGILERMLVIRGHTGFRPRGARAQSSLSSVYPSTTFAVPNPSFRERGKATTREALSGQRHFQFLQDKVFRIYGDLKRSPQFSEQTVMNWHNPKDQEHFRVIPEKFTMNRDVRRKFLYQYEIVCTIVGPAISKSAIIILEDKGVFDQIQDGIRTVRKAADYVNSAIADVQSFIADVEAVVSGAAGIVNDVAGLVNNVSAAVGGIERLGTSIATVPFDTVRNVVSSVENLSQQVTGMPSRVEEAVKQSFQNMADGIDHFSFLPEIYEEGAVSKALQDLQRVQNFARSTRAALEAAEADPPTSAQQASARSGEPSPGDKSRLENPLYVSQPPIQAKSARVETVQGPDNIASLAARYLGDARRWRELATFNRLQHPYISLTGEPNTLKPGDQVLIPSEAPEQNVASTTPGVFTPRPETSPDERTLGRDLKLVADRQGFFDFEIDAGSEDFSEIAGIPNLAQALVQRTTIEQGTDVLYRGLGYKRIIGIGSAFVDKEIARIRLGEAVLADPRVDTLVSTELLTNNPVDAVQVRIEAGIKGFQEPLRLTASASLPLNTV